jgi:hypothetical protein
MLHRSLLALAGLAALLLVMPTGALATARRSVSAQTGTAQVSRAPDNGDADAVALAKRVLAGGGDASAALLTALLEAGFTVWADDGSVAAAPTDGDGQGLAFDRAEADAMLASEGHFSTTIADLGSALAATIPDLSGAPVDQLLLSDLQDAANGDDPSLRFWSRFIAALGQQANPAVDPLTATDTATVQLDAVQFALVTRRLAGDLYTYAQQNGAPDDSGASADNATPSARYLAATQTALPCTETKTEQVITNVSALASKSGFKTLLGYLGTHGVAAAQTIGQVTGWSNALLVYGKLAAMMAAFSPGINMEGAPPLVRTKQAAPATGELRQFDATIKLDIGNAQIANCLRPVLNLLGLDFSLPNDGAVAGAEVDWYPRQGFDQYIVEFHDNPLHNVTDANGTTTIGIEGTGQDHDLPDDARPVLKPASVGIAVTMSPANLLTDLGSAASVVTAGPAGLAGLLPQLLQRSNWVFDAVYPFQVQDWEVVRYHGEGTSDYSGILGPPDSAQFTQHDTFSIDFDAPGDGKAIEGTGTLTATQNSSSSAIYPNASCTDSETRTYNFRVSGVETNGVLKLDLTLDGDPMPTCFMAFPKSDSDSTTYPPMVIPQGYVFLPDASPDPAVGHSGVHSGTVAIDDKDGATVNVPYTLPWPFPGDFTDKGTFTLTLHRVPADQQ